MIVSMYSSYVQVQNVIMESSVVSHLSIYTSASASAAEGKASGGGVGVGVSASASVTHYSGR